MGKLSEVVKTTYTKEIGTEKYTFTELSIKNHIEIETEYPQFDGNLLLLIQDSEVLTFEVVTLVLCLMLKHVHPDIEREDLMELPARMLPELYRDVLIGIYGAEENTQDTAPGQKKMTEEQTGNS